MPESFGRLRALTTLYIWQCDKITHLPDSFCNLHTLTTLNIYSCNKLTDAVLPNSICFCKNLQHISISNINMLPPSMILLEKIIDIRVMHNNNITTTHNINEMRLIWYKILKTQCV